MWDTLGLPWQAALEMAWEAYCAGTIPIGAVVADAEGVIYSRGRNRIMEKTAPDRQVCNNELAHAEINALLSLTLSYDECKAKQVELFTTTEPCPLCMGALYMSDVKTVHYAARDPWAGSTNLLGTTPYLSRKNFRVFAPTDPLLEKTITALFVESELHRRGEGILSSRFYDLLRETQAGAVEKGLALFHSGELVKKQKEKLPASHVFDWLINQVQ